MLVDPKRRRVYCSTDIYADCNSAPPTQTTGHLVAFDIDALAVVTRQVIEEDVPSASLMAVLPSGEVLAQQAGKLYAWEADEGRLRELGPVPEGCRGGVAFDPETVTFWTCAKGNIGRLEIGDSAVEFRPVYEGTGGFFQVVGRTLYYADGFETCAVDLDRMGE